ncbi:hypothetical protein KKC08_05110 [Patescibacteria group bacterium]|nr:hypothetical protein [Patescibacteria group bacterium]MCG2701748.1 DnaB helicase C-terminal domain-containing protein [Candidatus Parcubacteria bacterium]MBU4264653.1 hypothetical protein [Patescibacteria group bacterium]MBU4390608.1 hypothetical protein [Patescibacteria group bacterium]MBU4397516.1 hypothetical protein [Patescibacteria group bacterium]
MFDSNNEARSAVEKLKPQKDLLDSILELEQEELNPPRIMSGFTNLDLQLKGFRTGGCYMVAGIQKSGKSSLMMKIAINMIGKGKKVAFIDTELNTFQFSSRMTALWFGLSVSEAEENIKMRQDFAKQTKDKLFRVSAEKLMKENLVDFDKAMQISKILADEKMVNVLIYDNLTTYISQNEASDWRKLMSCITQIVNFTKHRPIISFILNHVKETVVISELPKMVQEYVKENEPDKIFDDSIRVIRKPTAQDIYGGGQAKSQLSGTLIVWRPYQNYKSSQNIKVKTQLILDNFRDQSPSEDVRMEFLENRVLFKEITPQSRTETKEEVNTKFAQQLFNSKEKK